MSRVFDDNTAVWLDGAAPTPVAPPLARDLVVDVAIIGGGFTGVSTAYHLRRRFPDLGIALLEAKVLGNGASGRNGGMMLTGITTSEDPDVVAREHAMTGRAIDELETLIREHDLRVRYQRAGCLRIATTPQAAETLHALTEQLAARGLPVSYVSNALPRGACGAMLDRGEGVLNGVDLIRAMRPLLSGVQIFEGTPVVRIREGAVVEVTTPGGTVRAKSIVLGTNGYTPQLGYFRTGILPVLSHVIATAPLTPAQREAVGMPFSDDRPRLAYLTIDDAGRAIFGGGTTAAYSYRFGNATTFDARRGDRAERALRASLTAYFPALADVEIQHRWTGPLGLTLARHCAIGVMGEHRNIYYAVGYSGHGVVLANLAGRVLTDLYADHHEPWRDAAFYMKRPSGIPPEPLRYLGYHAYTQLTGRSPWKRPAG